MYYYGSVVEELYFIPCDEMISTEGISELFLCSILARHGMPCKSILDCDPRYASRFWSAFVSALGCEHAKSSSHHTEIDR